MRRLGPWTRRALRRACICCVSGLIVITGVGCNSGAPTTSAVTTRALTAEDKIRAKSAEELLGPSSFGYSIVQVAELKAQYGGDLNPFRHTVVVGDTARAEHVTTIFDFTAGVRIEGYKSMIEDVRGLIGTELRELDPFRDGSRIGAQMVERQAEFEKIVVIVDQSVVTPSGWAARNTPAGGQTSVLKPHSLVRVADDARSTSMSPDISMTFLREIIYKVKEGATVGPTTNNNQFRLPSVISANVNTTIGLITDYMVSRKLSEAAAKAAVLQLDGIKFSDWTELIYKADMSYVPLASFADTILRD